MDKIVVFADVPGAMPFGVRTDSNALKTVGSRLFVPALLVDAWPFHRATPAFASRQKTRALE